MSVPRVNIEVVAGDTWSDTFEFYKDGQPMDMEGASLVVQFRPVEAMFGPTDEETTLLELTVGSGIEWTTPDVATVLIPPEDTVLLNPLNEAVTVVAWGLRLESDTVRTLMQGVVRVYGSVVR